MARRRKREFSIFSLSFLDIMSCGFGAVILFFVIINHATEEREDNLTADVSGEVSRLETEVKLEQLNLAQLQNSLAEIEEEIVTAEGRSDRLLSRVETERELLSAQEKETLAEREHINQLIADIQRLEEQLGKVEEQQQGDDLRPFYGEGDRQYLTGMRMGGQRILVLVDASASMLDNTIINIIRRRNLSDEQKLRSEKWQRALRTVEWLTTQFPVGAQFQILTFNVEAQPALAGTEGQWLDLGERGERVVEAVTALRKVVPADGTRLHAAFDALAAMRPLPDNVYLIIDSLPTQGRNPASRLDTVSSRERENFFQQAVRELPVGVPINVIMFPMEGDPLAPSEYWKLAMMTGGSYISPAEDWP